MEKKADKTATKDSEEKTFEKLRKKILKEIEYSFDESSYSFKFKDKVYQFKGFPSMMESSKIRAILNSIAPRSITKQDAEIAIYMSGDLVFMGSSKAQTHLRVMLLSVVKGDKEESFNADQFCVDENGVIDEAEFSNFGINIMYSEIEFRDSKKKQS